MADLRAFTLTPRPVSRSLRYNQIDGDAQQLLRSSARDGLELLLD